MKSSGKVLLGAGLFLVLALLGLLIATKALVGDRVATTDKTVPLGELERHIETTEFQRIQASGIWELEIIQGPQRTVRLVIPEYLEEDIKTSVSATGLILGLRPGSRLRPGQGAPRAIITIPALEGLEFSGATDSSITGFDSKDLEVKLSGGSNLIARDCVIGDLEVDASGATRIDMRDCRVENADIAISGAGSMEITMDGGDLDGNISGAASLTYYGNVRSEKVEKSGAASVKAR